MQTPTKFFEFLKRVLSHQTFLIVGGVILLLVAFQAGVVVGVHKASFGFKMGDNYYRAFGEDRDMRGPLGMTLPNAHGATGQIVSISLPTFTVDDHGTEKVVLITDDTKVRHLREEGTADTITVGDFVIVLGEPNEATQIEARLVRILPPPPTELPTNPAR